MGKAWDRAKAVWAAIGHIWLAKDIGTAIGLWTAIGVIAPPILLWLFTPASPFDLAAVAIIGGFIAFFLARHFAPKVLHHHGTTIQLAELAADAVAGSPTIPDRDVSLGDAIAYVVIGKFDRTAVWEDEGGAISRMGDALKQFEQAARDGKVRAWGKLENWSVYDPIPADYWSNHSVHFLDLFRDQADVEHGFSPPPHYKDLQVSRTEFEKVWPRH